MLNPIRTGWSQSGPLKTGNKIQTVSLQATFPEAGEYTVQFDIINPPNGGNAPGLFAAIADIFWSVQGTTIHRTISVTNGASITGVGEGVKVVVSDVTQISNGSPLQLGFQYEIAVNVAKGARPYTGQPPVLIYPPQNLDVQQNIIFSSQVLYAVPLHAGAISVSVVAFDIANLTSGGTTRPNICVQQKNVWGGILMQYDPTINTGFVPLMPGAVQVAILDLSGTDNASAAVLWGIDG